MISKLYNYVNMLILFNSFSHIIFLIKITSCNANGEDLGGCVSNLPLPKKRKKNFTERIFLSATKKIIAPPLAESNRYHLRVKKIHQYIRFHLWRSNVENMFDWDSTCTIQTNRTATTIFLDFVFPSLWDMIRKANWELIHHEVWSKSKVHCSLPILILGWIWMYPDLNRG